MWPIVTDVYLCVYVCLVSVCLPIRHIRQPTETDEPIEVLFGMWTRVAPRNHVLNEALRIPPQEEVLTGAYLSMSRLASSRHTPHTQPYSQEDSRDATSGYHLLFAPTSTKPQA